MTYARSGKSGLLLPKIALGLWQNFGDTYLYSNAHDVVLRSFDLGITHFDLANNYGPPAGTAETTFGRILREDLAPYRDELVISTKAGYYMWPGPYGDWGSRKYLTASLDQSLRRMGLDYVDIFYHHRPDPNTPLEETMGALDHAVRSGKAMYAGISNYSPEQTRNAARILRELGTPCVIHQPSYNMFNRWVEDGLLKTVGEEGIGCIVFSPLAQGLLTNRYLSGTPADSRIGHGSAFLNESALSQDKISRVKQLNAIAEARGQSLAQMAVTWILRNPEITTVLIGASKVAQVEELVGGLGFAALSADELAKIDAILKA
jgi:L-glyceraldehyde 3-phosphate reductase